VENDDIVVIDERRVRVRDQSVFNANSFNFAQNGFWKDPSSLLFRFAHVIVFGLGGIPQGEGNHEGGRGHDGEGDPIENVRRELAIERFKGHNAALSGAARVAEGGFARVLGGQVTDLGGNKIKVATLQRLKDGGVGDVPAGSDALPFDVELAKENLKVFSREAVVRERNVQSRTIAHVV